MAFGERINNPLNLRDFGTKWPGYVGPYQTKGNGVFARFDSPVSGYRAAFKNMSWIARKKGAKTIGQLINVWAPPADNNNTSAYVQRVAQMSGLSPNEPIPFNDPAKMVQLAKAMTAVELGKTPFPDATIQTAYQSAFNGQTRKPGANVQYGNFVFPPNYNPSMPTERIGVHPAQNPQPVQPAGVNPVQPVNAAQPGKLNPGTMALALAGQSRVNSLAKQLIESGNSEAPMHHPLQALGRLAQYGVGTYMKKRQSDRQAEALKKISGDDAQAFLKAAVLTGDPNMMRMASAMYQNQTADKRIQEQRAYQDKTRATDRSFQKHMFGKKTAYQDRVREQDQAFKLRLRGIDSSLKSSKDAFDREKKLRDEVTKGSKDFITIRDSYSRVQEAAKIGTGAGDIAIVFNFMKILDPNSVVRETEYATAENTAGVPTKIRNLYNKVLSGQRLSPEQRRDFVAAAERLYGTKAKAHQKYVGQYKGLAKKYGLDPEKVIIDQSPGAPQSGKKKLILKDGRLQEAK